MEKFDRQLDFIRSVGAKGLKPARFSTTSIIKKVKNFGSLKALCGEVESFATILRRYFISQAL